MPTSFCYSSPFKLRRVQIVMAVYRLRRITDASNRTILRTTLHGLLGCMLLYREFTSADLLLIWLSGLLSRMTITWDIGCNEPVDP